MIGKGMETVIEPPRHRLHMTDEITLLHQLHGAQADGGRHRMAGIGEAMGECAVLFALLNHPLENLVRDHDGRNG